MAKKSKKDAEQGQPPSESECEDCHGSSIDDEIMAAARARDGMEPKSDDEILQDWNRVRDGAQEWILQSVKSASGKGTKEAERIYNMACRHIENIERKKERMR
jgi:hypothetical protein